MTVCVCVIREDPASDITVGSLGQNPSGLFLWNVGADIC